VAWENSLNKDDLSARDFSLSQNVVSASSGKLARHPLRYQSSRPAVVNIPNIPDSTHLYFFNPSLMPAPGKKSTPGPGKAKKTRPVVVPPLVGAALEKVRDSFDARAGGGAASDEDYVFWGKEFIGRVVRELVSSDAFYY
jgi:hypothetical protein